MNIVYYLKKLEEILFQVIPNIWARRIANNTDCKF